MSKSNFLDKDTVVAIAVHGTDQHRDMLLKDHHLDDEQVCDVERCYSVDHWQNLVKKSNLTKKESCNIAAYGSHHSRTRLLDHHKNLPDEAKYWIAYRGNPQHIKKLNEKHQPLDNRTRSIVKARTHIKWPSDDN